MFRLVYYCPECVHSLSKHQVFKSDGCCPYCGHMSHCDVCLYEARAAECVLNWRAAVPWFVAAAVILAVNVVIALVIK